MTWTGKALPRFNKRRKKLSKAIKTALNSEVAKILQDPYKGDPKRGALKDVWVEKFKAENDQYLIAYEIVEKENVIIFWDIGQHENFYRDLERYKRETKAQ